MVSEKTGFWHKRQISLLLICALLFWLPAVSFADVSQPSEDLNQIDPGTIQNLIDSYFAENSLNPELISIGYIFTGTGESWYHNGDLWYYSASLYKVPLMMLYAEKEAAGELTQDSDFFGMPLSYLEDEILTYSNNDLAYSMMLNLADPFTCRSLFCKFADLPEDYYSWEYTGYSYFSARFMTSVMYTLFQEPDRFPGIIDRLKNAQPGHYFRMSLESTGVEVAQKYGNYHDEDGNDWNHTAGIVFTDRPFLLTVMTRYGGISENIIADLAELFYDYTISIDKSEDRQNMNDQEHSDGPAEETGEDESESPVEEPVPAEDALLNADLDSSRQEILNEDGDLHEISSVDTSQRFVLLVASSCCVLILVLLLLVRNRRTLHSSKRDPE